MSDYRLYDLEEDGSYYDDEYEDYETYEGYDSAWPETLRWKKIYRSIVWFFRGNFTRCPDCKRARKNCQCIPF